MTAIPISMTKARLVRWGLLLFGQIQPESDNQRRYVRIAHSAVSALAGKGVAVLVGLMMVPLSLAHLGIERYGIWVTISSLLTWLSIADLGLANGITNVLSTAYASDSRDRARQYISTAFWMLVGLTVLLIMVLLPLVSLIDWTMIFRVQTPNAAQETPHAVMLALLITVLGLPLSVVEKALNANQEGHWANLWQLFTTGASLFGLMAVITMHGGMPSMVLGMSGSVLLVRVVSAVWLFGRHKPWLRPTWRDFDRSAASQLLSVGSGFFVLQLVVLVLMQSDNLIIARFLGSSEVPAYSVTFRLFSYVVSIQQIILTPLWPAYAEAAARNDWPWVTRTFKKVFVLSMTCFAAIVLVLIFTARDIVYAWTNGAILPPMDIVILMSVWSLMSLWGNTFAILQNALGRIRIQTVAGVCMAIINITLSIILVQQIGVVGVIGATVISYASISLWIAPLDTFRTLRMLSAQRRSPS